MNHFLRMLDRLVERSVSIPPVRLRVFPLEAGDSTRQPLAAPPRLSPEVAAPLQPGQHTSGAHRQLRGQL